MVLSLTGTTLSFILCSVSFKVCRGYKLFFNLYCCFYLTIALSLAFFFYLASSTTTRFTLIFCSLRCVGVTDFKLVFFRTFSIYIYYSLMGVHISRQYNAFYLYKLLSLPFKGVWVIDFITSIFVLFWCFLEVPFLQWVMEAVSLAPRLSLGAW